MDYYSFYNGEKQVISQNVNYRKILVRYKKDLIIIDEYCNLLKIWEERSRMRLNKKEIRRLNEMV